MRRRSVGAGANPDKTRRRSMIARHAPSALWFFMPVAVVYAAAFWIVETLPLTGSPALVATALTIDLVVAVPALYYLVLVRGRGWPAISVAPVFLLSFGAASLLVPTDHRGLLDRVAYLLPAIELGVVAYVVHAVRRVVRAGRASGPTGGDFYDRARTAVADVMGTRAVADAVAFEISLLYYAFSIRPSGSSGHGFSHHRRSGYGAVVAAVVMIAATELVGIHILLRAWSGTAALVHAALSAYGMIWLIGDYRAQRRRPHELRPDAIRIRLGLRWDLEARWSRVVTVRRTRSPDPGVDYLAAVPIGSPGYEVVFDEPVVATGFYGLRRRVRRIGISVDDPGAFEARLRDLGVPVES